MIRTRVTIILMIFYLIFLMLKMKAAVYDALDFSLPRDQQRTLSRKLEEVMISELRTSALTPTCR